jgi:hypothetical protein
MRAPSQVSFCTLFVVVVEEIFKFACAHSLRDGPVAAGKSTNRLTIKSVKVNRAVVRKVHRMASTC